ncbi:MAG TPA: hypothetical protein VLJ62_31520 [Burkholderiaceae bacterium]|nr:hypothetical protein [Burkholderiaceae bacterium]
MFSPTACTTPTRLPTLMWSLAVALLLLSAFAPAFAMPTHAHGETPAEPAADANRLEAGSWRLLSPHQMIRAARLRRADGAPSRMVPLAVLPSHRSALWLGLSSSRSAGARIELRWTIPLDGNAPDLRGLHE